MRVLFVCRENTCRSVMAENVFRKLSSGRFDVMSAGVEIAEKFDETALKVLEKKGYPAVRRNPKKLEDVNLNEFDILISVCDETECVAVNHPRIERWNVKDPKGKEEKEYYRILEIIEKKVSDLVRRIENEGT